jgi:hypothetical protein
MSSNEGPNYFAFEGRREEDCFSGPAVASLEA